MVFEPPGYEPEDYEPPTFEPWDVAIPDGTDPDRHPDPDLTVFVEVGSIVGILIEV